VGVAQHGALRRLKRNLNCSGAIARNFQIVIVDAFLVDDPDRDR
jgi:hypothetical protein